MAAAQQPHGPQLHGQWVLEKVVNNGRETKVPTSLDVYLIFGKNNEFRGFDGCSWYDATLQRSSDGSMKVVEAAGSGNGCLSLDGALGAARGAIDILFYRSRPITISETGHQLTIATRGHSLTYIPRSAVRAAANAFRRLSVANGEPNPHDAAYVITTYKSADEFLGHHRPLGRDGNEKVYLIIARGNFGRHDSGSVRPPTETTLYAAYNDNAADMESGILHTRPDLAKLGTVVPLRL